MAAHALEVLSLSPSPYLSDPLLLFLCFFYINKMGKKYKFVRMTF